MLIAFKLLHEIMTAHLYGPLVKCFRGTHRLNKALFLLEYLTSCNTEHEKNVSL